MEKLAMLQLQPRYPAHKNKIKVKQNYYVKKTNHNF